MMGAKTAYGRTCRVMDVEVVAQNPTNKAMQMMGSSNAEVIWRHFVDSEVADMTMKRRVRTAAYQINVSLIQSIEPKRKPITAPRTIKASQMSQPVRDVAAVRRSMKMGSFR